MVEIEGKPKSPSKRSRKKSITSFSEDGSSNQIHMAMQNWSALPKEDIENEYLIVNYIVSVDITILKVTNNKCTLC